MKRRDFVWMAGCFVGAASLTAFAPGCKGGKDTGDTGPGGDPTGGDTETGDPGTGTDTDTDTAAATGLYLFEQGVASGDPRATSVVLWTRCVAAADEEPVAVTVQVSTTEDFAKVILEQEVTVDSSSDHTLRLLVTELSPNTKYYYRFIAGADVSDLGRTFTAPAADDLDPVHFAWVSCQDFAAHFFHAYAHMIAEDEAAAEADQIKFVVHLGDFIYETIGAGSSVPLDELMEPIELVDAAGEPRIVEPFPGGGVKSGSSTYAESVDDYRHLYKQFLRDPHLRAARARWPFIHTWDDHEFTNDSWQTQANYTSEDSLDEASQQRKVNANQAWFEFVPVNLSDAEGVAGVPPEASDFVATSVKDVAYGPDEIDDDNLTIEPNNLAAIDSMTIYRSFRFGKNVELVMTDERSYRSDHAIPEESTYDNGAFFDPRNALPLDVTNAFDAGRTANGGKPPDQVFNVDNPRMDSPPGTMLGAAQKAWWKATMSGSDANWKIWGNEVPLMRFFVNQGPVALLLTDRIMSGDMWDGYNTERNELMQYLRDNDVRNVVTITGDVHAHFAGLVMDDHDTKAPTPVAAEFIAAGAASNSLFSFFFNATSEGTASLLRNIISYDATPYGGTSTVVENMNNLLLNGSAAADTASKTHDAAAIAKDSDDTINPYLRYADTNAQGYGRLTVTETEVTALLVTMERPLTDTDPVVKRTATFTLPATPKGGVVALGEPVIDGTLPFPLDL